MGPIQVEKPIVKKLDLVVHRPASGGRFIEFMAEMSLVAIGFAAFKTEGVCGYIAQLAWVLASVQAIMEHSKSSHTKMSSKTDQQFINNALDQFKHS